MSHAKPQKRKVKTSGCRSSGLCAVAPLREKSLVLAAGLLLLLSACNSTDNSSTPVITGPPNTTYPMPPLSGNSLLNMGWEQTDGKRAVFSDYKGKVLVLDLYATWCVPCRVSIPHLIGLQQRFERLGLQVVGLNVGGPEDEKLVPAFAKELNIQYPLAKPDEELVRFLTSDNDNIPQTFVFDREGKLVRRFIGFDAEQGEQIDLAVKSAIESSAAP